jgi:hypothetical protein
MTRISVRLPTGYHKRLLELSSQEGISINLLITLAIGEKLSALDTEVYIQERANRANRINFEKVLNEVHNGKPEENDSL